MDSGSKSPDDIHRLLFASTLSAHLAQGANYEAAIGEAGAVADHVSAYYREHYGHPTIDTQAAPPTEPAVVEILRSAKLREWVATGNADALGVFLSDLQKVGIEVEG